VHRLAVVISVVLLSSCARPGGGTVDAATPSPNPNPTAPTAATDSKREIRLTGIVEAVHSSKVMVPTTTGNNNSQVTLTRIVPNGARVAVGDFIAEFDPTPQFDSLLQARGKSDDLGHQAEQKAAANRADAEKRKADLIQAQADLNKAQLELQKGPILAAILREQNEIKAEIAREHVESLQKSNAFHDVSDAAALRILELQRDRQKVAMQRAQDNISRLQVKAPIAGLVAQQNLYRGNSNGRPQEGDQLYRGQALVSIFDPSEMLVRCSVGEPDGAALVEGVRAKVYFDAYPDLSVPAHFEFASPMALTALGSPIKTFMAVFKLDKTDPRLMPDLSAAVVIEPSSVKGGGGK
jgi:multidrug efflux pump subunit AcrA (membrane-fusion protein)